jgi:hypothetical protein
MRRLTWYDAGVNYFPPSPPNVAKGSISILQMPVKLLPRRLFFRQAADGASSFYDSSYAGAVSA